MGSERDLMYYYRYQNRYYAALKPFDRDGAAAVTQEEALDRTAGKALIFLREADPAVSRFRYRADEPRLVTREEGPACLDPARLVPPAEGESLPDGFFREQGVTVENAADPRFSVLTGRTGICDAGVRALKEGRCRLHVAALGDVGSTMLMALKLLGGDVISEIGIYDLNRNLAERWERELNQMAYPEGGDLPEVRILEESEIFDCDVFVFAATASVPPVGSGVTDVRLVQFEANRRIMAIYASAARRAAYSGLFCVVSDPVDLLCRSAYELSNTDDNGAFDGRGLRSEQIHGFGLGVMYARAAYYAGKAGFREVFLREGRAYGPHGEGLVIADSVNGYDHERSLWLTTKTVAANREVRDLGYKPYAAPAVSSGALSILTMLRGGWHDGSVFLGGSFMGVRSRLTDSGLMIESRSLPEALYERICRADAINRENYGRVQ
ncbi:MAG: lactate dehydrogenase [Lachnospiraceae bacterium]|nr:lactate dehydrogenase [Lachnospiraceae bacterium]